MGQEDTDSDEQSGNDTRITATDTAPEDATVVEERDVRDVPEEDVDQTVDEMLNEGVEGVDDTEESTDSETTEDESTDTDTGTDLTEMDPGEVSVEDLEEQEWTLGEEKDDKLIEFKGTKFLFSEPDDDDVLDIIAQEPGQDLDPKANMLKLCNAAIKAPELTAQRWEHEMNMSERLGLTMRAAQYIGIEDFMDFPDGGPEAQAGM